MFHGKQLLIKYLFRVKHFSTFAVLKIYTMEVDTLTAITNLFSNVAFPVGCCIALFWTLTKQNQEIKNAIENNTKVLTELTTLIKIVANEKR